MRKNIPLQKAEGISGVLEAIAVERDALLEEIYSWHENEIVFSLKKDNNVLLAFRLEKGVSRLNRHVILLLSI